MKIMLQWTKPQVLPIGLDIGRDSVKMLQFVVQDGVLFLHWAAKRALDHQEPAAAGEPGELISPQAMAAIGELLRGGHFRGRSVVAALPRQIVQVKNLRLPQMPQSELASVVQFEAQNLFSFEREQGHVEFLAAGEVRQGSELRQEVIVLGARGADVDRFVEALHNAALVVDSLDAEPCALYRTVARFVRRRDDEQEVHVLIDLGMQRTQVLIGKGREISFFKSIDTGGARFNEAVSQKVGITLEEARALRRRLGVAAGDAGHDPVRQAVFDATRSIMEDLAKEISLCLRYYSVTFRGQRPNKVRLIGGEAYDPQLLTILSTALNVPVEAGRLLYSVDCRAVKGMDRKSPSAEWALAAGLALKRATGSFAPLDGTPRTAPRVPGAEVVDLNAAMAPGGAPAAPTGSAVAAAQGEHFAALRRAAAEEPAHA